MKYIGWLAYIYMLKLWFTQYKLYTCVDWCNFKKQQSLQHEVNEGRSRTDDRSPCVNSPADEDFNLADYSVPMEYENVNQLGSSRPAGNYQELNSVTIAPPHVYSAVNMSPNSNVSSNNVYEEIL